MAKKYERMEDWNGHFTDSIPQAAHDFIRDEALRLSRYIFTERVGKKQYGYCTHCKTTFASNLRHGDAVICPECGSACNVKAAGIKRSQMVDQALITWYGKSPIDPNAITARCIWCVRDYRGNYKEVETTTVDVGVYVFSPGKAVMFYRNFWFNFSRAYRYAYGLSEAWNPDGALVGSWYTAAKPFTVTKQNIDNYYSRDNVDDAISGTPFQFSCWEEYDFHDMTRFFGLYAVAPCIEYFTKLRMKNLVMERLKDYRTYGAVNWKGKNLLSVLRMTKQEFNAIRDSTVVVEFDFLAAFHAIRKAEPKLPLSDSIQIADQYRSSPEIVQMAAQVGYPLRRVVTWVEKQMAKEDNGHRYHNVYSVIDTWKTYLDECRKLELDMSLEAVVMPRSLYRAHQRTLVQIKVKDNKALEGVFAKRAKELSKLKYSSSGLFIVPARTMREIIVEGQTLKHCVGGYAESHANGKTAILFIRSLDKPKTPFYTMELRNKAVVQVRGFENHNMTPEVQQFVEEFKAARLADKPSRKQQQTKIAAMA